MKYSLDVALVLLLHVAAIIFGSSVKSFVRVVGVKYVWERSGEAIYALETCPSSILW